MKISTTELSALQERVVEDTIEKLKHLLNRLQMETEWQQTKKRGQPVPKSSYNLLHFTKQIIEFTDKKLG